MKIMKIVRPDFDYRKNMSMAGNWQIGLSIKRYKN